MSTPPLSIAPQDVAPHSSLRDWLVPPILVPIFFGLLIVVAVLVQW